MEITKEMVKEGIVKKLHLLPHFKLYKYRECNKNNFDALENQYAWMPYLSQMPDDFDGAVNFDFDKDLNEIHQWFRIHGIEWDYYHLLVFFIDLKNRDLEELRIDLKNSFNRLNYPQNELNKKQLISEFKVFLNAELSVQCADCLMKVESLLGVRDDLFDKSINFVKSKLLDANKVGRESILILSLAESYKIHSMWEMYTNNKEGFCIEYDFRRCLDNLDNNLWLASLGPMIYEQRPHFSAVNIFQRFLDDCLLVSKKKDYYSAKPHDANFQIFLKDPSYAYEREWRLTMLAKDKDHKLPFPFVSAVYAGINISKGNLKHLKKICTKLAVPLYLQRLNTYSSDYEYVLLK